MRMEIGRPLPAHTKLTVAVSRAPSGPQPALIRGTLIDLLAEAVNRVTPFARKDFVVVAVDEAAILALAYPGPRFSFDGNLRLLAATALAKLHAA